MKKNFLIGIAACLILPVSGQNTEVNGTTGASRKSGESTSWKSKAVTIIKDQTFITDTLPIVLLDEMPIPYEQYKNLTPKQKKKLRSIETLKGAEATAIYGSRGVNGVIVLTSKSFKSTGKKVILPDSKGVYYTAEEIPVFPGGNAALIDYIKKYISEHPASTTQKGRVMVRFVVSNKGVVENPMVIKALSEKQDALAIDVCKNMPAWKPARIRGKNVAMYMTLPFIYN